MAEWTRERHADAKKRLTVAERNDCNMPGCPSCLNHKDMHGALDEIERLQALPSRLMWKGGKRPKGEK